MNDKQRRDEIEKKVESHDIWKKASEKLLIQKGGCDYISKEVLISEIINEISKQKNKAFKGCRLKNIFFKKNIKTLGDLLEQEEWLKDEKKVCNGSNGVGPYTYRVFMNVLYEMELISFKNN